MKKIVICEGKTDAILIGYFLTRTRGLVYDSKCSSAILPVNKPDQNLAWFKRQNALAPDFGIWSVGGFDRIGPAIMDVVKRNALERNDQLRFQRLLVIVDMDDFGLPSRIESYKRWLKEAELFPEEEQSLKANTWKKCHYAIHCTPSRIETMEIALFLMPEDSAGSLETYLLNSLEGEGGEHQTLINAAKDFISGLGDISFIKPRRFKDKACLGSTLAVIYPDWVFSQIDQKLLRVNWDDFQGTSGLRAVLDYL